MPPTIIIQYLYPHTISNTNRSNMKQVYEKPEFVIINYPLHANILQSSSGTGGNVQDPSDGGDD